ncbi:hypothetical protein CP981_24120 [Streptomyces platensis]|uniref:Uncharacterized protein n=1 Tax=Streptomyces platensis TaxID=58346 RepID=A0AAE6TNY0_STRPT|nr:hypothetical protein BG653_07319 [Streptomyces platensis]QEV54302.1 hypothetical protein CP981_24120 [Streptomyces platensis]
MSVAAVETYKTRTPDAEGWPGVPFRHPADMAADDGRHDGGPMPPEAPRDPQPSGGDSDNK